MYGKAVLKQIKTMKLLLLIKRYIINALSAVQWDTYIRKLRVRIEKGKNTCFVRENPGNNHT